jgi:prolyl-tRNA synthetase
MRSREFLMKDAYSFHLDMESLNETYQVMHDTYCRIFTRLGLEFRPVDADSGSIGGSSSLEFHVLADSGEDRIAVCDKLDYAANVDLAEATAERTVRPEATAEMGTVKTPGQQSIKDVATFLSIPEEHLVKTMLVQGQDGIVALILRGDHELNLVKAEKHPLVASPLTFADETSILGTAGCGAGSIGPVGLDIPVIADRSAAVMADFVCGANKEGVHLTGVNWGRDLPEPEVFDLRNVNEGDLCVLASDPTDPEARLTIRRGIEVGHIFQLGTRYSEAMNATCLDREGKATIMPMGCYGIGVSRIVAAAIEQNHDDNGIIWPSAMAPFEVIIIPIGMHKSEPVRDLAEDVYSKLLEMGVEVLLDDRNERPGIMFADSELIGIPHRLVIGDRGLERGVIEYKSRSGADSRDLEISDIIDTLQTLVQS